MLVRRLTELRVGSLEWTINVENDMAVDKTNASQFSNSRVPQVPNLCYSLNIVRAKCINFQHHDPITGREDVTRFASTKP